MESTGATPRDFVEGFTLGAVAGVAGMFIPAKQPQLTNEAGETVADPLPVGMGFTDEQMRLAREHAALEGQLRNLGQWVNENVPEAQRKARFDIMRRSLTDSILAKKDELNKSLGIAGEGTGVLNNKKLDYLEYNISPGYWESWMGGTGERFRIYYDASVPGAYEEAVALGHKAMMKGGLSKIKDDIRAYIKSQELAASFLSGDEIIGVGVSAMEGDTKGVVINLAAIILPGLNKIDEIGSGVSKVGNLGPNNALEDATRGLAPASDAAKKAPDEAVAKLEKNVEDAVEEGAAVAPPTTMTPGAIVAPTSVRPSVNSSLPGRVTQELPAGGMRTPAEVKQARNFFERNHEAARKWYEQRTGEAWPEKFTHYEHPRPLKDGGDPLFVVPGFNGPNAPHMIPGPDGLTDFQRWGRLGGRPPNQ